MSKTIRNECVAPLRSNVAYGMITAGTGKKQIFKDKRQKRGKERKDWTKEWEK
jgi:hypothetical protein